MWNPAVLQFTLQWRLPPTPITPPLTWPAPGGAKAPEATTAKGSGLVSVGCSFETAFFLRKDGHSVCQRTYLYIILGWLSWLSFFKRQMEPATFCRGERIHRARSAYNFEFRRWGAWGIRGFGHPVRQAFLPWGMNRAGLSAEEGEKTLEPFDSRVWWEMTNNDNMRANV